MNLSYTKDSEFKPLGELLLEDNEEIKELKSLYQREEEYLGFLGPIESFIAHFYLDEPKLKDVDVIKISKPIGFEIIRTRIVIKTIIE